MTKKEIVKAIAEKYDQSQVLVKDIVQETFNLIVDTLVQEGRIELRNFGVFEVKLRKARRARNPKTNQAVTVGAKKVVTFQAGKVMEERAKDAVKVVEPRRKGAKGSKVIPSPSAEELSDTEDEFVPVGVGGADNTPDVDVDGAPPADPLKPR